MVKTKTKSQAGERTHPLKSGTVVDIHNRDFSGNPIIEGRAIIVKPCLDASNYYYVKFDRELGVYPRFVMPDQVK